MNTNQLPDSFPPLPWRPFHPAPLSVAPELELYDMRENRILRAVMEIIERRTRHVALDVCSSIMNEQIQRAAGALEAYLDLHRYLTRAVEQEPKEAQEAQS